METEVCDCGHEYCEGYKSWETNPYAVEINDDYTLYFECGGSRHESAMDI